LTLRQLPRLFVSPRFVVPLAVAALGAGVAGASLADRSAPLPVASEKTSLPRALHAKYRPCSRKPSRRRYVAVSGSDGSAGTLRRPWRTIGRALRSAAPGDAVYVRSGTYSEWVLAERSGTTARPITLLAYPGERPVITGRLKIEGAFFCVRGLRFEGRTPANTDETLIYVSGAQHVEILRNKILNAPKSGIFVGDDGDLSEDVSIISNVIRGNGTEDRFDHGIYLGHVREGLIANNLLIDNRAIGVQVYPEANGMVVTQNTVVDNGKDGIVVGGGLKWSSNDNLVVNNIVAFNKSWGIRTSWEESIGSRNRALRNLVFGNGEGAFWFPGGGMSAQRSIRVDPRFFGDGNFRLRAGSPALNRGIPTYSMRFDITGRMRPRCRGDLGAFER
jgi:Right handed beta helix region/Protein of unknown function (DUF1565)